MQRYVGYMKFGVVFELDSNMILYEFELKKDSIYFV